MFVTHMCKVLAPRHEELDTLMRVYGCATRYAFNRLLEGETPSDLIKIIPPKFQLNKRYAEDIVLQAQAIITSQTELVPLYLDDTKAKLEKTIRKIDDYTSGKKKPKKIDLATCLHGLSQRKAKLEANVNTYESHMENGTIPPVIFGGRANFFKRMKGTITKEEWKDLRSNRLYSRGDKSKSGNLNLRIVYRESENAFYLEVANPLRKEAGRRISPRMSLPIRMPQKFFREMTDIVMGAQVGVTPTGKPMIEYVPYTVEVIRKNGTYYVHISYEETVCGTDVHACEPIVSDRIAGVDLNVDRIAVSIVSKQGNLLQTKIFYMHDLETVSSEKRDHLIGRTVKALMGWLLEQGVGAIVMEDLSFSQQHDTNKRQNRMTCQFAFRKLSNATVTGALRHGFTIKKVNPAYTSVIGRLKYSRMYGISVHEAASYVIGRRGLGFRERLPTDVLTLLRTSVRQHLICTLALMEEGEKQSESGKARRKRLGMYLKKIEQFQTEPEWSRWNILQQTVRLVQGHYVLQTL